MNYYAKFSRFDRVTEFRLWNSFLVSIGMAILSPILISLKGQYLLPYIISIFAIIQTISVFTNNYIVNNYSLSSMYKMGVVIHLLFIVMSGLYFFSPILMIYLDSILGVVEIAIFSAYTIALNNYLAKEYPDDMSDFQIIRNSSWANGYLIGLGATTILTYYTSIGFTIGVFIGFNAIFSLWLIKNWRFFDV